MLYKSDTVNLNDIINNLKDCWLALSESTMDTIYVRKQRLLAYFEGIDSVLHLSYQDAIICYNYIDDLTDEESEKESDV